MTVKNTNIIFTLSLVFVLVASVTTMQIYRVVTGEIEFDPWILAFILFMFYLMYEFSISALWVDFGDEKVTIKQIHRTLVVDKSEVVELLHKQETNRQLLGLIKHKYHFLIIRIISVNYGSKNIKLRIPTGTEFQPFVKDSIT